MVGEFKAFLLKSNALALAIGVIIGGALGTVVTSLVEDIIMPPIGKLLGGVDFSALAIDLGGGAAIRYGSFINSVITFIIVALVVWQIGNMFLKEETLPEVKTCPFCAEPNALSASKCRACTSTI
jgi:large conductance mechanosensitive channel